MLVYVNMGRRDFETYPIPPEDTVRYAWDFWACLQGKVFTEHFNPAVCRAVCEPTLWLFPADHRHSWGSEGEIERAVFHFTVVPSELEELLPSYGYYEVPLTDADCSRIREWALYAREILDKPTMKFAFAERMMLHKLGEIALRQVSDRPLATGRRERAAMEKSKSWFAAHMDESPGLREVCSAMHISTTHLRRIFHKAEGRGPHAAFNEIRMRRFEALMLDGELSTEDISERIGFSSASALNRAVKNYFGHPPQELHKQRSAQRERRDRQTA